MPTGKVKWFNPGEGFRLPLPGGRPRRLRAQGRPPRGARRLKPGQRVEFGIVAGRRGDQALQVRVLDPLPSVADGTPRERKKPDEMVRSSRT